MLTFFRTASMIMLALAPALAGCKQGKADSAAPARTTQVANTCSGVWPSYWQDPAFAKTTMWQDQYPSNTPASQNWVPSNASYTNPPFQLADAYAAGKPDDPAAQTWRAPRFDALFKPTTPQADKATLANAYGWALMRYIQEGNIDSGNVNTDWNLCANRTRQWFNMPFQTYAVLQGREFIHGLTREAPVTLSVSSKPDTPLGTTVWAVAFYNGNAAPTLASVWKADGTVATPSTHLGFAEGTVVGKLLFTTADANQIPMLQNVPRWTANISTGIPAKPGQPVKNPTFCTPDGNATMPEQSLACKRSPGKVTLMQFDVAVRDSRAPNGWVFGTFVADGQAKAGEKNPWNRISLLGLIWGDDSPPLNHLASTFPANPRANGFNQGVIAWDVVDRINKSGGNSVSMRPGHLGCNSRLNGPADNVASSCTSCHMTASVPDSNNDVPPLLAQFNQRKLTPQCAAPDASPALQQNNVTFAQMDSIYFAQTRCSSPFQTKINGVCVLGPNMPDYADHRGDWISTDFSLQMSGALVEWNEWQGDLKADRVAAAKSGGTAVLKANGVPRHAARVFTATLPVRGEE